MEEWLDNKDILMYSTHNEDKSVVAERFIKTLKVKIYKNTTANDSKSYLLIRINQQINTIILIIILTSINKKPINADYSALTKKIETNPKVSKFKVNDKVRITKCKNIFSKGYTKK